MKKEININVEYLGHHRYGLVIDGNLVADFDTFDEAMDECEKRGGPTEQEQETSDV